MSGNPITTGRIGRRVYDLRHWKLTLFVAVVVGIPSLVFRVLSGRNLFGGGRSTDATFLRRACEVRKGPWNDLSGAARAGIRLVVVVGVWLWTVVPTVVYILAGIELVVVVCVVVRKCRERLHEKRVLRPVWPAVAGIIGVPETQPPSRWLDIPPELVNNSDSDEAITIGLRTADADDDKRQEHLVRLFDQRFGVSHYATLDYARRRIHLYRRPSEPTIWQAVCHILGIAQSELAKNWLVMPEDPDQPGSHIYVRIPADETDHSGAVEGLRVLAQQQFEGTWEARARRAKNPVELGFPRATHIHQFLLVALTNKPPEPKPPKFVDFLSECPDYAPEKPEHQEAN